MFHLIIGLLGIGILIVFISILLFGIVTIAVGLIGGTSAALLLKRRTFRNLLLVSFCILVLIGFLSLIPLITVLFNIPVMLFSVASVVIYICVMMLTIVGIRFSRAIHNKIGKAILHIVFYTILIAAIAFIIFTLAASFLLL